MAGDMSRLSESNRRPIHYEGSQSGAPPQSACLCGVNRTILRVVRRSLAAVWCPKCAPAGHGRAADPIASPVARRCPGARVAGGHRAATRSALAAGLRRANPRRSGRRLGSDSTPALPPGLNRGHLGCCGRPRGVPFACVVRSPREASWLSSGMRGKDVAACGLQPLRRPRQVLGPPNPCGATSTRGRTCLGTGCGTKCEPTWASGRFGAPLRSSAASSSRAERLAAGASHPARAPSRATARTSDPQLEASVFGGVAQALSHHAPPQSHRERGGRRRERALESDLENDR